MTSRGVEFKPGSKLTVQSTIPEVVKWREGKTSAESPLPIRDKTCSNHHNSYKHPPYANKQAHKPIMQRTYNSRKLVLREEPCRCSLVFDARQVWNPPRHIDTRAP